MQKLLAHREMSDPVAAGTSVGYSPGIRCGLPPHDGEEAGRWLFVDAGAVRDLEACKPTTPAKATAEASADADSALVQGRTQPSDRLRHALRAGRVAGNVFLDLPIHVIVAARCRKTGRL